jgi:serine/threonine protein kinase
MSEFRIAPGVQIGEYILEGRIGAGGMGEVWRANQPLIETTVAIKILTFEAAARKSQLERFLREARAVNRVQHRNLAKIFSFGELPDGRPYFVMEFLAGLNLRDFLRKHGVLPYAVVYHITEQVCRTLIAVHEQNVIHRDLKPENVFLVTEPGSLPFVKVLDFGVAKLADKEKREHPTQTGATLGTPGYMAPEQYENSKTVDVRADIYSVAVIIFEMICGEHPFELAGETAYVVIAKQLTTDAPKLSEKISTRNIPKELDNFLQRSLSRKIEERPKDCKEFLQGFRAALGELRNERELPTHAGEPTKLSASYQSLKAKKNPPPPMPKKPEPKDERLQTQVTPPPVSSKFAAPMLTDKMDASTMAKIVSDAAKAKAHPVEEDADSALATQRFKGHELDALQDPMQTTPDTDMPELLREMLAKKMHEANQADAAAKEAAKQTPKSQPAEPIEPEEIDFFDDDEEDPFATTKASSPVGIVPRRPATGPSLLPINTPEPISLPTTSPGRARPMRTALVGVIAVGVALLALLGWSFLSGGPKQGPPKPLLTASAPVSTSAPVTQAATTQTTEDPKSGDLCESHKEEIKKLITAKSWPDALKVLAFAQEKCPKDAEVQRLFGYTYEQKGDRGFACIRYNKALSFGLTGASATRTKKAIKELKCQ